jgi:hypothetical protein
MQRERSKAREPTRRPMAYGAELVLREHGARRPIRLPAPDGAGHLVMLFAFAPGSPEVRRAASRSAPWMFADRALERLAFAMSWR